MMGKVAFKIPWLLFAMIPLIAVSLLTFFLVNKRFRYQRGKVMTLIIGVIIAINASLLLAGMTIKKVEKETNSEILFLVDASASMRDSKEEIKQRVKNIVDASPSNVNFGLSIFANEYKSIVKISSNRNELVAALDREYQVVKNTTNMEDAIEASTREFENISKGKIVLLTDGIETDGTINSAISKYLGKGLKLDVSIINTSTPSKDIAIMYVQEPSTLIKINELNRYVVKVQSMVKGSATLKVYDDETLKYNQTLRIIPGQNDCDIDLTFTNKGIHILRFEVESDEDDLKENNRYLICVNIEDINKMLIINNNEDDRERDSIFSEYTEVKTLKIKDSPSDLDSLREYDQIVLNNIANADMPPDLSRNLATYVKKYGGGLLTLGGTKLEGGNTKPRTYVKDDMQGSQYQSLLPIECEEYQPPIAVVIVIDISGSMLNNDPNTGRKLIDIAKEQAIVAVKSLDDRDYVGVVTFGSKSTVLIDPTPLTKRQRVLDAIQSIEGKLEGSVYSAGVERAGLTLRSATHVSKKHILFISDGAPGSSDTTYLAKTSSNKANGISTSTIGFGSDVSPLRNMAISGGGKYYHSRKPVELSAKIKEDLQSEFVREYDETRTFRPEIALAHEVTKGVTESNIPELNNFFGTRLKYRATAILTGAYGQPILATHEYGRGKVTSLLTDFAKIDGSEWTSGDGKKIIKNMVEYGFPNKTVRAKKVELVTKRNNYKMESNIFSKINEGDLSYKVTKYVNGEWKEIEEENCEFAGSEKITTQLSEEGIYKLEVTVVDTNGKTEEVTQYYAVSYSSEYKYLGYPNDKTIEEEVEKFKGYVRESDGRILDKGKNIFDDLSLTFVKVVDLRYVLGIIILVLFIIDLAVRKFRWKFISEIVKEKRDAKKKK